MPLADKIIELRKKQGWSQIDLADRLDVSRQSVSKWEMAQAVPELDKIIKMSELFAVTTDYLLKDEPSAPDSGGAVPPPPSEEPPVPESGPEPEAPPPAAKPKRKKWPWVLAVCLVLALAVNWLLLAAGVLAYRDVPKTTLPPVETAVEQSSTEEAASETVMEGPAQEAVSDPDAAEDGMTKYVYEGASVTADGIDEAAMKAMEEEYAPYGLTCEDGQWCLDGQPIRVFTDVLSSNGESLTGGHFQGVIRNFAGEGDIDVRTVRDYDHCDADGNGTLLCIETCDVRLGSAHWTEHHAEEEHH